MQYQSQITEIGVKRTDVRRMQTERLRTIDELVSSKTACVFRSRPRRSKSNLARRGKGRREDRYRGTTQRNARGRQRWGRGICYFWRCRGSHRRRNSRRSRRCSRCDIERRGPRRGRTARRAQVRCISPTRPSAFIAARCSRYRRQRPTISILRKQRRRDRGGAACSGRAVQQSTFRIMVKPDETSISAMASNGRYSSARRSLPISLSNGGA